MNWDSKLMKMENGSSNVLGTVEIKVPILTPQPNRKTYQPMSIIKKCLVPVHEEHFKWVIYELSFWSRLSVWRSGNMLPWMDGGRVKHTRWVWSEGGWEDECNTQMVRHIHGILQELTALTAAMRHEESRRHWGTVRRGGTIRPYTTTQWWMEGRWNHILHKQGNQTHLKTHEALQLISIYSSNNQ